MSIYKPVTLITGASAGIGVALAKLFAADDRELALVARRERQLAAVADEIAAAGRKRPHVIPIDLGRSDSPARIGHELLARGLEPEIVVNNAGFGLHGEAADLDRATQLAMVDLNIRTLTDLSLRWIDSLTRHRGGVLNVASVGGFVPGPRMAVYCATKSYVLSFSEALHHELKPKGVRVTALCPGPVKTEFQQRAGLEDGNLPALLARPVEQVALEGYTGFMQGRRLVVPGWTNKVVTLLPRVLPRTLMIGLSATSLRNRARPQKWPRPAKRAKRP